MQEFKDKLFLILESDEDFKAAVAIVKYNQKWLLGLSTAKDDRSKKWCCPGGGIKRGESPQKAAERECLEETGVKCTAVGPVLTSKDRPGVAFVPCTATGSDRFKPNSEFTALGFFETSDFNSLELYKNVRDLIGRARRKY
jgi:8-oxo-dGTP pyrophosphatase MutT (NUDIX family)